LPEILPETGTLKNTAAAETAMLAVKHIPIKTFLDVVIF
jgi:hypothetical protein